MESVCRRDWRRHPLSEAGRTEHLQRQDHLPKRLWQPQRVQQWHSPQKNTNLSLRSRKQMWQRTVRPLILSIGAIPPRDRRTKRPIERATYCCRRRPNLSFRRVQNENEIWRDDCIWRRLTEKGEVTILGTWIC